MINIPSTEFSFTFSRSSGAGGQNVNKVNSRVTLIWDITNSSSLAEDIKHRFIKKYKRYFIDDKIIISSQKSRSQNLNISDCINKLHRCLETVEFAPKPRKPTKPSKSSVKKRLDSKKKHSVTKGQRREKF